jgi:hypothetical protein
VFYNNGYHRNQQKYYTFSFRLHSEWDFSTQRFNIGQFIADYTDTGCGEDSSPTTMIWLKGTELWTRVKNGQLLPNKPCPPKDNVQDCSTPNSNCQPVRDIRLATGIKAGQWYKLALRVNWRSDDQGEIQAWLDGNEVLPTQKTKTTVLDDGRELQFRVGLYANDWHDQGKLVGSQTRRQIWIDEVAVGSAPGDVGLR